MVTLGNVARLNLGAEAKSDRYRPYFLTPSVTNSKTTTLHTSIPLFAPLLTIYSSSFYPTSFPSVYTLLNNPSLPLTTHNTIKPSITSSPLSMHTISWATSSGTSLFRSKENSMASLSLYLPKNKQCTDGWSCSCPCVSKKIYSFSAAKKNCYKLIFDKYGSKYVFIGYSGNL